MTAGIKFGRSFSLEVQGQKFPHTLQFPLTCVFNISRSQFASLNTGKFSLYGLSELSRKDIYFDRNILQALNAPITFRAGYLSQNFGASAGGVSATPTPLPIVFTGSINSAYTSRSGPDIITQIDAMDGGFGATNAPVTVPYSKGMTYSAAMLGVMQSLLPTVNPGQINITQKSVVKLPEPFSDTGVFNGPALNILRNYLPDGANVFIDLNTIHILGVNDALTAPAAISEITSDTGLLGIPIRTFYTATCSMIFEPCVVLGQVVKLTSTLAPWVNDTYKVIAFTHHGTISGVESGDAITDLTLQSTAATI